MELTYELAQPIVDQLKTALNYNINIMNHEGNIVASSDINRINSVHKGALDVVKTRKEKIIYPSEANNIEGTKPGVNLPIYMYGSCIGTVGVTGHPDKVYEIANIVKLATEALIQQKYLSDKLRFKREAIKEWFLDLIKSDQSDIEELNKRAKFLNLDIDKRCSIILIKVLELGNFNMDLHAKSSIVDGVVQFLSTHINSIFQEYIGNDLFVVAYPVIKIHSCNEAKATAYKINNYLKSRKLTCLIGIGNSYTSSTGYIKSYFEAEQSLRLIARNKESESIMHLHDWGIIRVLDKVPDAAKESFLEQYMDERHPITEELRVTLHQFLQLNQDIGKTAQALHIHRNTLVYRLEKVKANLNLDPRNFNDAILLKFILFFQE